MKILICLSVVPDTTTKIHFTDEGTILDKAGIQWIINPWDELALTRAIELKENPAYKIENITTATVGLKATEAVIKKALAMGADKAYRVDAEPTDAFFVANQLHEILQKEKFDIVLFGIESSDYNNSAVGGMVAEMMGIPSISSVMKLEMEESKIRMERAVEGGSETVIAEMPVIAIVQKGIAKEPKIASMRGIMLARKKPITTVSPVSTNSFIEFDRFELPKPKAKCKIIDEENVKELVDLLHNEAKVI